MSTDPDHALQDAAGRLARVLTAENAALAAGDLIGAARLLPEKNAAADALRAALPNASPDAGIAARLKRLSDENAERLSLAIEVQGRILELVARAARQSVPQASQYGRRGTTAPGTAAQAITLRA
ncbi:MAG: hypothetical protein ACRYGM_11230 [Janthinobacterium lividum]